ncbi:MAG: DUF4381 domain-containing protein [Pseudomonadales bacterium]|nr:DUF4381 domain-containing protein [Pseudomonadales bacterium]
MESDLLQQLRDIHLPVAPGWWPPAPGWWLLALLTVVAMVLLLRWILRRVQRQRPVQHARRLYQQLYADYRAGLISPPDYLHQSNELLKRLMIFALGEHQARKANDDQWLALLDKQLGADGFTRGPGKLLGNQRFRADPQADIEALHPLLLKFFAHARAATDRVNA